MSESSLGFEGFSGRIGRWSFQRRNGRTFIRRRPARSASTEAQIDVQRRFRLAASYAKAVAADPMLRIPYEPVAASRKASLYQVAMTDYLRPPEVGSLVLEGFTGVMGNPVKVIAFDDVDVMSVTVAIRAEDDTLLEQGAAVRVGTEWVYTTTMAHPQGTPVSITATAADRPGNKGSKMVTWS